MSNTVKILAKIHEYRGATSISLVASDLGLAHQTVRRYVTAMVREGLVEFGPDGCSLSTTAAYDADRLWNAAADKLPV